MQYSIVNNAFALANASEIETLAEVGIFSPVPIGRCTLLSGVDIQNMAALPSLYNVPDPILDETPIEYGQRVRAEVVSGVAQIIAGTLDGLVIDGEGDIELYRQIVGWTVLVL